MFRWAAGVWNWLTASSSRAAAADVYPHERTWGISQLWTPTSYADYYQNSVPIFAAIKTRSEAINRAVLLAERLAPQGRWEPTELTHPLQVIANEPNPEMDGRELFSTLEIHLCIWGRAHIAIEIGADAIELWPVRPDRLAALPGSGQTYVRGYRYQGRNGNVFYPDEDIITFSYHNPRQDRTGLSPIAPVRLSADMGIDAVNYNRKAFSNGGLPDFFMLAEQGATITNQQKDEFYEQWDKRYQGAGKAHRPALVSGIKEVKNASFSARELEWLEGLKWTVADAGRVYGVPEPLIGELSSATLANINSLTKLFWHNTMMGEVARFESKLNTKLLRRLGYRPESLRIRFDLSKIDALTEEEEPRRRREVEFLEMGVLSINEVRAGRGMPPIPEGDDRDAPSKRRGFRDITRRERALLDDEEEEERQASLAGLARNGDAPG